MTAYPPLMFTWNVLILRGHETQVPGMCVLSFIKGSYIYPYIQGEDATRLYQIFSL